MNVPCRFLLALSITLGACATPAPAPTIELESATDFAARSLGDPRLKNYMETALGRQVSPWPLPAWDEQALSLAAFYYQPELSTARARWASAQAAEISAGGHPNPTLALLPEYNTDAPANLSPWTVGLNLNFLIETAGKRQYRLARAQQLSAAARFDVAATAWRIHSHVRAKLLDLYAAQRTHTLLDKELTLAGARRVAIEQRVAAGAASRPEAAQAAAAVEQIQLAQRQSERQELADRSALAQSLGVPVAALQGIEFSFAAFEDAPGRIDLPALEARQRGLASRPELLAALADYAASESALQLALAGRIPNVEIGPGYKWDEGAVKWSLGIALTLPIAHAGPIAEAAAQRNQAAARFNSLQAKAIGEIDQASAAYQLALHELDAAAAMSATAQQQVQAAEQQLRAGEADRLALLEAGLQNVAGERTRLAATMNAHRSFGALEDALQQPLVPRSLPVPYQDPRAIAQQGSSQ